MLIGELAERAGVTPRTIRYYEQLGLLGRAEREQGGFRRFGEEHLARLVKIDQLKDLGLSLDEIADVIDLYFSDLSGVAGKRRVLAILERHLVETEERLDELRAFRAELRTNIARMQRYLAEAEGPEME